MHTQIIEDKQLIKDRYIDYVSVFKERPASLKQLGNYFHINHQVLLKHFSTTDDIEKEIFSDLFKKTVYDLASSELSEDYQLKEKLLSIFYNWVNNLSNYSFFVKTLAEKNEDKADKFMDYIKNEFTIMCGVIIGEAIDDSEVGCERNLLVKYKDTLWDKFILITHRWLDNNGAINNNTDTEIVAKVDHLVSLLTTNSSNPGVIFGGSGVN
ncbi:MAG: hypothetical protein ACJAZ3_000891 [Sphingobacteriales bacterium]|jgi:hypothetical protein